MKHTANPAESWDSILVPGKNCWRVETSDRLGVVIDVADYFSAFKSACSQARQAIYILGWDFDRLEQVGRQEDDPNLEEFLCGLLERNEDLHIYLLLWDFNMIYAAEREWFQSWRLRFGTNSRLHVQFDNQHPVGASHHQKIVVIDDAVAFNGGVDLSRWRWDTSEHKADDSRRKDADGKSYPPFHDVMCVVDGAAAQALGELARTRWKLSPSTDDIVSPQDQGQNPWPEEVEPLFLGQQVAISRTFTAGDSAETICEVRQLFLDSIRTASSYIYIENQYFTSKAITNALADRLEQDNAPEVVLVLPHHTGGWLEQVTMDGIRQHQLQRLQAADRNQRLRVYYPVQPGLPKDECISVHAKLVIMDDSFIHIGSANTSDRSMGLDSECDLAWVAPDDEKVAWLLHRLLAEHLGCSIKAVRDARDETGSLLVAISQLQREGKRSLQALATTPGENGIELSSDADVIDPAEPIDADYFVRRAVPGQQAPSGRWQLVIFVGFIILLLAIAAAWRWTPLADSVSPEKLAAWLEWFQLPWLRFTVVLGVIIIASLMMLPLSLLVVACAILLGPWSGFACSMLGALASAWIAFQVGDRLGGRAIQRLSGSQVHKLSQRLSNRGILAVAMLRLIPVAPYTVVNLAAGASHLRQGQFLLGSALGLLPGIGLLTLFSGSLMEAIRNPSMHTLGVVAGVVALIVGMALVLRRTLAGSED